MEQAVRRDAQVDPARRKGAVDVGELFRGVVEMQVSDLTTSRDVGMGLLGSRIAAVRA